MVYLPVKMGPSYMFIHLEFDPQSQLLGTIGDGSSNRLYLPPKISEDEHILANMFSSGWFNHHLE